MKNIRTNPDTKLLKKVFKGYPEIEAVYLFGSAGTGKMHRESDIDLAIYPDCPGLRKQKLAILSELARLGFCNVDLVFMDRNDIVLQYEAVRQNILVYRAPGFDRGSTFSKIIRQYFDFYPYLTVQRNAYKKRILGGQKRNYPKTAQQA
jgi:predicted nucleotidyltransferase